MRDMTVNRGYNQGAYPRGFTGSKFFQEKEGEASQAVEQLYHRYINDNQAGQDFEFREKVLKTALGVFGAFNFQQWFFVQYNAAGATDLHVRFLDDTLKFLSTGRREISLENWAALIRPSVGAGPGKPSELSLRYFCVGERYDRDSSWPCTVQDWCAKPGGFEDLLNVLHICFGGLHC